MSVQSRRVGEGGRVERSHAVTFYFNGRRYTGYAGDTLASALLANGVSLVGRSFKYHRPRGIMTAGAAEPNAIVQLGAGGGDGQIDVGRWQAEQAGDLDEVALGDEIEGPEPSRFLKDRAAGMVVIEQVGCQKDRGSDHGGSHANPVGSLLFAADEAVAGSQEYGA